MKRLIAAHPSRHKTHLFLSLVVLLGLSALIAYNNNPVSSAARPVEPLLAILLALNGFRYGTRVAAAWGLIAALAIGLMGGAKLAILFILMPLLPILLMVFLLNLKLQLKDRAQFSYFPLAKAVAILALYLVLAIPLIIYFFMPAYAWQAIISNSTPIIWEDFSYHFLEALDGLEKFLALISSQQSEAIEVPLGLINSPSFCVGLSMAMITLGYFLLTLLSVYIGLRWSQWRGKAQRPFISWPKSLYIPRMVLIVAVPIILFAPLLMKATGLANSIFYFFYICFCCSFVALLIISAFASLHSITSTLRYRRALLAIIYMLIVLAILF